MPIGSSLREPLARQWIESARSAGFSIGWRTCFGLDNEGKINFLRVVLEITWSLFKLPRRRGARVHGRQMSNMRESKPIENKTPDVATRGQSPSGLVFIVEDDRDISSLVSHVLTRGGFQTRIFHVATGVSEAAIEQTPVLILLDGMLPDQDGLDLLRLLEKQTSTQGIRKIMLSARAAESDKVRALELGADDYITKPFSTRELIARVNAVLRNPGEAEEPHRILCVGPLFADLDAREVSVDSRAIALTATEFNLLVYFMQHSGQVISRDKLMADLWRNDRNVEEQRVVDVYIRRLRTKIELDSARPSRLLTIRGNGYLLVDPCGRGLSHKQTTTILPRWEVRWKSHVARTPWADDLFSDVGSRNAC